MSSDPALALQGAIFDALRGQTAAGDAVYDVPPTWAPPFPPRITIGPGQTIGDSFTGDCINGSECFLDVDVWGGRSTAAGAKKGFVEVKEIADQVRGILDEAELPLDDGHRIELMTFQSTVYQRETDGITHRARMLIRVLTQAETTP